MHSLQYANSVAGFRKPNGILNRTSTDAESVCFAFQGEFKPFPSLASISPACAENESWRMGGDAKGAKEFRVGNCHGEKVEWKALSPAGRPFCVGVRDGRGQENASGSREEKLLRRGSRCVPTLRQKHSQTQSG